MIIKKTNKKILNNIQFFSLLLKWQNFPRKNNRIRKWNLCTRFLKSLNKWQAIIDSINIVFYSTKDTASNANKDRRYIHREVERESGILVERTKETEPEKKEKKRILSRIKNVWKKLQVNIGRQDMGKGQEEVKQFSFSVTLYL